MGKLKTKDAEVLKKQMAVGWLDGKNAAWIYCKGKAKGHFKDIDNTSDATLETSFLAWRDWKRQTFSLAEYTALGSEGATKEAKVNEFVDYGEEETRRHVIIITVDNKLTKHTNKIKEVDPIGGDNALSVPLSSDGQEPATHYGLLWMGCASRAHAFFEDVNDWDMYDAAITSWADALTDMELQVIQGA